MQDHSQKPTVAALRVIAVLAAIGAITFVYSRLLAVNATTVALTYLLAILVIATSWGLMEAAMASLIAVLCFNFFFLPPLGTLTIADPQNWVALFVFLATSIIASQLSARARQRTVEAVDRRLEMERLYALSRAILLTDGSQAIAKQLAQHIAHIFELTAAALYDRSSGEIHRAGTGGLPGMDDKLRQAAIEGALFHDRETQTIVSAIRLGGEPIGSFAIRGAPLSNTALQALSNLVATGLERARGQEAANRAEAARQSEELKSTLLDAIAHEFKTPLTSIKAATTALLSLSFTTPEEQRELVTIVDEEADRLGRLVSEAIQMARIEAGNIQLNKELHQADHLISAVVRQMEAVADGRAITVRIAENLPMIPADAELIELAMRQLVDNAVKYSPPGAPLFITAKTSDSNFIIGVGDQGPGIPEAEQSRIFEKFYRGPNTRRQVTGAGMGLAIAREILHAHNGEIWVKSSPGQGSEFWISVPVAPKEMIA